MAERRAVILVTVVAGETCVLLGTPLEWAWPTAGVGLFLLAFVYAQLTRPKDRI